MKAELVKLSYFCGKETSIYGIFLEKHQMTTFDLFIQENKISLLDELKDIISRLKVIGSKTGAREQFFKTGEGKPGDGVCALYDNPDKKLRLYCIRYGTQIVIIGGGGPKNIQKLQENAKLESENSFLRELSTLISERIREGEIKYSDDYHEFMAILNLI
jgi:hypothetical protein